MQMFHAVQNCVHKVAQVIVQARIPNRLGREGSNPPRRRNNQFNFQIYEDSSVREKVEAAMEKDPHALISIDISVKAHADPESSPILLERWSIKYEAHELPKKMSREDVWKNILLLVRSVYSYAKILPAAQLCRSIDYAADEEKGYTMEYKLSTTPELTPFGSSPRNFVFAPIETPDGKRLQIWVSHRKDCNFSFARRKVRTINPQIIKDYLNPSSRLGPRSAPTNGRRALSNLSREVSHSKPPPPLGAPPIAPRTSPPPPPEDGVRKASDGALDRVRFRSGLGRGSGLSLVGGARTLPLATGSTTGDAPMIAAGSISSTSSVSPTAGTTAMRRNNKDPFSYPLPHVTTTSARDMKQGVAEQNAQSGDQQPGSPGTARVLFSGNSIRRTTPPKTVVGFDVKDDSLDQLRKGEAGIRADTTATTGTITSTPDITKAIGAAPSSNLPQSFRPSVLPPFLPGAGSSLREGSNEVGRNQSSASAAHPHTTAPLRHPDLPLLAPSKPKPQHGPTGSANLLSNADAAATRARPGRVGEQRPRAQTLTLTQVQPQAPEVFSRTRRTLSLREIPVSGPPKWLSGLSGSLRLYEPSDKASRKQQPPQLSPHVFGKTGSYPMGIGMTRRTRVMSFPGEERAISGIPPFRTGVLSPNPSPTPESLSRSKTPQTNHRMSWTTSLLHQAPPKLGGTMPMGTGTVALTGGSNAMGGGSNPGIGGGRGIVLAAQTPPRSPVDILKSDGAGMRIPQDDYSKRYDTPPFAARTPPFASSSCDSSPNPGFKPCSATPPFEPRGIRMSTLTGTTASTGPNSLDPHTHQYSGTYRGGGGGAGNTKYHPSSYQHPPPFSLGTPTTTGSTMLPHSSGGSTSLRPRTGSFGFRAFSEDSDGPIQLKISPFKALTPAQASGGRHMEE
eukprot:CAMPEP_0184498104 /NCGR_PEP_ID=MMETSP0113_2-20130426/38118_1 /TAXON_ID=91329 /ORGANISM="Norrisiella sphaerica, Strain BC52" /LENGTH=902 /DNA_ID=CAMNT_0026885477 /DNA_START=93 /DNA_END=2802 /DNA_ORIENTATION=+